MSDKPPAHEIIVKMIGEVIRVLSQNKYADELKVAAQLGAFAAEIEILKRMALSEKHRKDVVNALRQIKTDCPLENVGGLLTDKVLLAIATLEKTNKT